MRLFWLVLLLGAIIAVLGAQIGPQLFDSYVLVRIAGLAIETSVLWLLAALLVGFLLLHLALWLWRLPSNTLRKQLEKRAQAQLEIGMMALTEGDFKKAEKALAKSANTTNRPALNYVAAAQAAQAKGDDDKRDEYLAKAEQATNNPQPIIVSRAQLLLASDQPAAALELLEQVNNPKKPRVLEALMHCHERLENWQRLVELTPRLSKADLLSTDQAQEYRLRADRAALTRATTAAELQQAWQNIDRNQRRNPLLLADYASHAIGFGETAALEKELRGAIGRNWSDQLVMLYGQLPNSDSAVRLKQAEKWQKAQPANPMLNLTIARLASATGDNIKARKHFERSLELDPTPEASAELGRLLASEGDRDPAIRYFDQAIRLYQGEAVEIAQPTRLNDGAVIDAEALPAAD